MARRVRAHRQTRGFVGAVAMLVGITSVLLHAHATSAPMAVGVIVSRSCVLDAQPAAQTSSRLRLACAPGATNGLQVGAGASRIGASFRFLELLVPTDPITPAGSARSLRVLVVNF